MKKRYLISALLGSTLLLGACNQGDDDSKHHKDKKETSHKTEYKKSHKDNGSTSKNHSSKSKDDNSKSHISKHQEQKFDKKQHIAMALFEPGADKYSITAKELLDGEYDAPQIGNSDNTKSVSNLTLTKDSSSVTNTPDNVTFYKTNPSKPDSVSLIGVSDKEIILFGSQSKVTYDEAKQQGKVLHIKNLEAKYNEKKNIDKVAKKINIADNNQQQTEDTNNTQTPEFYAQVWMSVIKNSNVSGLSHKDVSEEPLNPYNKNATAKFPDGMQFLSADVTAAGQVYYTNNNDGTITVYSVPSHFQDKRWMEDDYSKSESERILNNGKVYKLVSSSDPDVKVLTKQFDEDDEADSGSQTSSSSSKGESKVTRDNVIDKVEDYEGHKLNIDKYTYKEPEKTEDGSWGFSYTDKAGTLRGSYKVDGNGDVTKYDEKGNEI